MKQITDILRVMTAFPYTIDVSGTIDQAKAMVDEHDITHLPVVDGGRLAGITTKRDIELAAALAEKLGSRTAILVGDICIKDPFIIETTDSVLSVVSQMIRRQITSALVVKNGRLVGIFTAHNVCKLLIQYILGKTTLTDPPDILA